jgi:peptidoglycan-associated lipoprotein
MKTFAAQRPSVPMAAPTSRREGHGGAIYFDFDSATLRDDARSELQNLAGELPKKQDEALVIEGNCDELGTVEYNLALREQRARSAKEYLSHMGVPQERIRTLI